MANYDKAKVMSERLHLPETLKCFTQLEEITKEEEKCGARTPMIYFWRWRLGGVMGYFRWTKKGLKGVV